MKKLSFTLLIVLSCLTLSRAQWIPQALGVLPDGYGIIDISAVDENVVWAFADDNMEWLKDSGPEYILRSTDGGDNWDLIDLGELSQKRVIGISAISGDAAWLSVSDDIDAFFYQTTNGGQDWDLMLTLDGLPNKFPWPALEFVDSDRGYFVSIEVRKSGSTQDGGMSWAQNDFSITGLTGPFYYSVGMGTFLEAKGDTLFWATSERIARSLDGGATWDYTFPDFPSENTIISIGFDDTGYGLAISDSDDALPSPQWFLDHTIILKSENFGESWEFLPNVEFPLTAMTEIPGEEKTFVAVSGGWGWWDTTYVGSWTSAFTVDGGMNWVPIDQDIPYTAISFASMNAGWVGTAGHFDYGPDNPGIFKFDPTIISTKEVLAANPELSLFPNPTTDLLNITWPEILNHPVEISVFNMQGELVHQQTLLPGRPLEVIDWAPGFYTLKMVDEGKVFAGKFVKL